VRHYRVPRHDLLANRVPAPDGCNRAGATSILSKGLDSRVRVARLSTPLDSGWMPPMLGRDDLIDARGIALILGLGHPNSVSTYQRRYSDMPRPVVDLGPGRPKLWSRVTICEWARATKRLAD
jgi:hypothetical protein